MEQFFSGSDKSISIAGIDESTEQHSIVYKVVGNERAEPNGEEGLTISQSNVWGGGLLGEMFYCYLKIEMNHHRNKEWVDEEDCEEHAVYEAVPTVVKQFEEDVHIENHSKVAEAFQAVK